MQKANSVVQLHKILSIKMHMQMYNLKNKGYLVISIVPRRPFNIHGTFPLEPKMFLRCHFLRKPSFFSVYKTSTN